MGRKVDLIKTPSRVISLVPSQTELLIDMGVNVVGRTKFCVHPKDRVKDIPIVGGTKKFRFDQIRNLSPDLIVGNKEENYKEGIEILEKEYPVWMSDIFTIQDALSMMKGIGIICQKQSKAAEIISESKESLAKVKGKFSGRVIYFIWKKPWMAAGKQTFIDDLLTHLGYENVIDKARYPEVTLDEINLADTDILLLSSEPYPFKQTDIEELGLSVPQPKVKLVDGELFSWYGSRMRHLGDL